MPGLLIKNLPSEVHRLLREEARRHHRSMTKEALFLLEQGLQSPSKGSLRDVTPASCSIRINDEWIKRAKEWGRS